MFVDACSLPQNTTIETDVCIVGAGVAGITLAHELLGAQFRVCLLESGDFELDDQAQALVSGESVGHPYYPLETTRARGFGGSSHLWTIALDAERIGARLHPLDAIDFEKRDWVPYSGWPFPKTHLDPYYARAHGVCQAGPFTYEVENWDDADRSSRLRFATDRVVTTMFHFTPRDTFISHYRDEIRQAANVTTYLNATVLEIETTDTGQSVTTLRVACGPHKTFGITASLFVLALGGIETPRLLLLSNKTQDAGLGNQHDLVGRFFMEHPHLWSGLYIPSNIDLDATTRLYAIRTVNKFPIMGKLTLSEEVMRHERLLNYCVSIHPSMQNISPSIRQSVSNGWDVVRNLCRAIYSRDLLNTRTDIRTCRSVSHEIFLALYGRCKYALTSRLHPETNMVYRLNHMAEQTPNPNSRVTLAHERDALGQNRVRLDWQLTAQDMRSLIRSQEILDTELRRARLGRLRIDLQDDIPPPHLHGGWHHMGTTRMHENPKMGVVDANGKIHDVANLFVAGPSIFPTGGYANPILTTVALSIKLADHVKTLMRSCQRTING